VVSTTLGPQIFLYCLHAASMRSSLLSKVAELEALIVTTDTLAAPAPKVVVFVPSLKLKVPSLHHHDVV
jgi:hypothetical protein